MFLPSMVVICQESGEKIELLAVCAASVIKASMNDRYYIVPKDIIWYIVL